METVLFAAYPPSPALAPYVFGYSAFTSGAPRLPGRNGRGPQPCEYGDFRRDDPLFGRVVASSHQTLFFNLGRPYTLGNGAATRALPGRGYLLGAVTEPALQRFGASLEIFGVTFLPGAAPVFFRPPADELTDRFLPLDEVWGAQARALAERLAELPTAAARIGAMEAELLRRLRQAPPPDARFAALLEHVGRARGAVTVESLAAAAGISRQHLARRFRRVVGVGPKRYTRIARFYALMSGALHGPPLNWAAAAAEFGYYDQAHLIGECREFTGLSPTELFLTR